MSLVSLSCTVEVKASQDAVWNAITDWESQGAWMLGTDVIVPDDASRAGVGARIEAFTGLIPKRRFLGFLDTMTVTAWDPPKVCDVLHTGKVVRGTGRFELVPMTSSRTVFLWSEELRLPFGPLGRVAWIVVGPLMKFGVQLSLNRFARYVESR